MSESLIPSSLVSDVSESLRSLTKNERCERIAQVSYQKWATMSDSLWSHRGNERSWAKRSGCSPKMSKSLIRSFLGKKQAIRSENWWAKSQPWYRDTLSTCIHKNSYSYLSILYKSFSYNYFPHMCSIPLVCVCIPCGCGATLSACIRSWE